MGNMVRAEITIKGTRPLFQHVFGEDALPLEEREKTGVAGNDPEEWRRTCAVTKEGQLFMDGTYAFATIREGGKYTKRNRASLMRPIIATLQIEDSRLLVDRWWPGYPNGEEFDVATVEPPSRDVEEPVYLDVRGVRNPSTKASNIRYRIVASPGWQTTFGVLWDKTIVSRAEMEAVLHDAGMLVGIGTARAIGMGRFSVSSFEVEEV